MIFLSAQPDQYYFLWQLQLQLFNFQRLGIHPHQIHVLIGYDPKRGLSTYFKDLIKQHPEVNIHAYEDSRVKPGYLSSIRPHLIAKHFRANKHLETKAVFYHDSDIIFNRLPDFEKLSADEIWYASDTRNYTDSNYIKQAGGIATFGQMSALIGVSTRQIEQHDLNCGGAQYLLKKVSASFWEELESNSESMFSLLHQFNMQLGYCNPKKIQAWCSDMWCIWWQAIRMGKQVAIHDELDFAWADTRIDDSKILTITHYTGSESIKDNRFFRKNDYFSCSPFNDDFSAIDKNSYSHLVTTEIRKYKQHLLKERCNLTDFSFLIPVRIDSEDRLENVYIITKFIHQYFHTNIILIEADDVQKLDPSQLPDTLQYHFIKDDNTGFHRTRYNNLLIGLADTPYIALYDTDVILPINQITAATELLRTGQQQMVYPYDGNFIGVDLLMKAMFSKLLNTGLFEHNSGKLLSASKRSYGGCVFLNRKAYQEAGLENEHLTSWGPDDVERWKRMLLLGYQIKRIPGSLYHLPHQDSINSGYPNKDKRIKLTNEYLKISSMQRIELEQYISTWNWANT